MSRTHIRQGINTLLLLCALCMFAACGTETASQPASPRFSMTQTTESTPTSTPTPVPSHMVHFMTTDHVQLAGLLFGQGKTAVICSHELSTTKAIWSESSIVPLLVSRGYQVLAYDFRGNGDSGGDANTGVLDVDLRAAVAFMRQQGAKKIVLLGSSMGGTATLNVAAGEQVAAVITLSAPQDFGSGVTDAQVKAIKAPKLFINSQSDDYASDTQHMYDVSSLPKEIHLYPGSNHGTSIFDSENGNDLTQRILSFIGRYAGAS